MWVPVSCSDIVGVDMVDVTQEQISIEPIISYPREAEVGKTYLMTIDLRRADEEGWPYDQEEYTVRFMLDTAPLFDNEQLGEPAVVLHRFGGTYGPAHFLLTASEVEVKGSIRITLTNKWLMPIRVITLDDIEISHDAVSEKHFAKTDSDVIDDRYTQALRSLLQRRAKEENPEENVSLSDFGARDRGQVAPVVAYLRTILESPNRPWRDYRDLRRSYVDISGEETFSRRDLFDFPFVPASLHWLTDSYTDEPKRVASIAEAIRQRHRILLLGDPGSGKSTLLQMTLVDAAEACLENPEQNPLPIYLQLYAWPSHVSKLQDWIELYLSDWGIDFPFSRDTLLLLDGLDELETENKEMRIASIRNTLKSFDNMHVVITCRQYAYTEDLHTELNLERLVIQPLDDESIQRFLHSYIRDQSRADVLSQVVQENALINLARNPYFLIIIILIYERDQQLPNNVASLLQEAVNVLWMREARKVRSFTLEEFNDALSDLAFAMIAKATYVTSLDWAMEQIKHQRAREILFAGETCGVVVIEGEKRNKVRFSHQLIQEYFAALAVKHQLQKEASLPDEMWESDRWRSVVDILTEMAEDDAELMHTLDESKSQNSPEEQIKHVINIIETADSETLATKRQLMERLVRLAPELAKTKLTEWITETLLPFEKWEAAVETLTQLDIELAKKVLAEALQHSDSSVRWNTVDQLAKIADNQNWLDLQQAFVRESGAALRAYIYEILARNVDNHPFLIQQHTAHFIRAIEPTEQKFADVSEAIESLHVRLSKIQDLERVYLRTIPFGSFVRSTAIRPISDIDVLILLRIDPRRETPTTAYEILKIVLQRIYSSNIIDRSTLKTTRPTRRRSSFAGSLLIDLPQGWLEVSPAVVSRGNQQRVLVPDTSLQRWIPTNHEIHARFSKDRDDESNGIYSSLVKAVKWWQHFQSPGNQRYLSGFVLECLIAELVETRDTTLLLAFSQFLARLPQNYPSNLYRVPELGVPGSFKQTGLGQRNYESFMIRIQKTSDLIKEAEKTDDLDQKFAIWQQIFGSEFPRHLK